MKILVTGANRENGIGAELVKQLRGNGHEVFATARKPTGSELPLDVADERSIAELAKRFDSLDVLINNAGTMGDDVTMESLLHTFAVNAAGPLLLTRALLPALKRGSRKLAVHISSRLGSIEDNTSGGYYAYRMSKAALNMASRTLHAERRGIISVVLHPGWVQTDMGGHSAPLKTEDSAAGMIKVIEGLSEADSGHFYDYKGQRIPF